MARPPREHEKYNALGLRLCINCNEYKDPEHDFPYRSRPRKILNAWCKACVNERDRAPARADKARMRYRRRTYGVTEDVFAVLLLEQRWQCAICGLTPSKGKGWHIDHDHHTGKVRALLCATCNSGIGMFNDDPQLLRMAIAYLERYD